MTFITFSPHTIPMLGEIKFFLTAIGLNSTVYISAECSRKMLEIGSPR